MENQTPPNPQDSQQLNNSSIEPNLAPKQKNSLLWPVLITFLISGVIFGLGGYFLGSQSLNNKQAVVEQKNSPVSTPTPEVVSAPNGEDNQQLSSLPSGWTYKSNGKCDVEFAIPPKKEPYYYPADPSRAPSVINEQGSGRFWDFPRGGVYPNLLSKLPSWDDTNFDIQAVTMFASPEEASGYVSQAVVVSCIPNNGQYSTNSQLLSILNSKLNEYNASTEEKGMQSSTYIVKTNTQTQRWGQGVVDLVITEGSSNIEYTMFVTPKNIYEVKMFGATEDSFVRQTAKQIFDNLRFEN